MKFVSISRQAAAKERSEFFMNLISNNGLSDMSLANVEALASIESGGGNCCYWESTSPDWGCAGTAIQAEFMGNALLCKHLHNQLLRKNLDSKTTLTAAL